MKILPKFLDPTDLTILTNDKKSIDYFDKGGTVVDALTYAKEIIKKVPSILRNKISKVVVANSNGTIFQVFEQLPNGTRRLAGQLELNIGKDFVWPKYVKKLDQDAKHVSLELYDAAIAYHNKPLVSGWELLAPEATQATWAKYFNKTELSGEVGKHKGETGIIMSLNQPSLKVVLMKPWQDGTVIKLEEYAKGKIPKKLPEPEFIKRKKKELEERQNDLNIHPHDWNVFDSRALDDEDEFFAKILAGKSLYRNGGTLEPSTKLNKFQEGGVLEESIEMPIFRHLPNEYIAQDFDNDLTELFYSRQIKYGQLSEKAERKLLKKYNLDYILLKETLDDLFNAGLGEALIVDLIKDVPENLEKDTEEKLLKDAFLSAIPTAKQGTKLIPKNAFGSTLMRELVPKASKITGKTERQLIKELALGTLSEKKLIELTKDVVESVNGKILKPELIKPGMLDFEHYWYFGHGTDVEHLPSIMLTGLKGSLSDTAINLFLIGNLEVFDAALEMAKQGKGLHHNAKGFNVILVPKLPGQTKPPKDLLDYLTPEEVTSHIVEDRTPARFNYFAVDTTI